MRPRAVLRTVVLVVLLALVAAHQEFPAAQSKPIVAETYYNTFSRAHAVLARIKPGAVVSTKTIDASGRDDTGTVRARPSNPLTGPFYVEGAEPGDALVVRFTQSPDEPQLGMELVSARPVFADARIDRGHLSESLQAERDHRGARQRRAVGSRSQTPDGEAARAGEQRAQNGVCGQADARMRRRGAGRRLCADLVSPSGNYGGNLDYNEIGEGTTVILPVFHPGALLFIGDGHALQGDGEPTGTGIETSMDVEFTVEVRKKVSLTGPRAETSEHIISIGSQPEFASSTNRGLQIATSDMVNWLTSEYKMEPWAAHLLIGYQGRYDIVTVAGSVGAEDSEETVAASTLVWRERNILPEAPERVPKAFLRFGAMMCAASRHPALFTGLGEDRVGADVAARADALSPLSRSNGNWRWPVFARAKAVLPALVSESLEEAIDRALDLGSRLVEVVGGRDDTRGGVQRAEQYVRHFEGPLAGDTFRDHGFQVAGERGDLVLGAPTRTNLSTQARRALPGREFASGSSRGRRRDTRGRPPRAFSAAAWQRRLPAPSAPRARAPCLRRRRGTARACWRNDGRARPW